MSLINKNKAIETIIINTISNNEKGIKLEMLPIILTKKEDILSAKKSLIEEVDLNINKIISRTNKTPIVINFPLFFLIIFCRPRIYLYTIICKKLIKYFFE